MVDVSKLPENERNVYYSMWGLERHRFSFLSNEEFSAYCKLSNDLKEEFKKKLIDKENQFPLKPFLKFISKLLIASFISGILVFFPYFINIFLFRNVAFIVITECILLDITIVISYFITKYKVENYGIKKRRLLVTIYWLIIICCFVFFALSAYRFGYFVDYSGSTIYTEKQIINELYFSALVGSISLNGLIIMIRHLKKVNFFSCRHCNKLNILIFGSGSTYSSVHEHKHYESGYYEESITEYRSASNPYGAPKVIGITRTHIPGQMVSDGLYKHTSHSSEYTCPLCKKTKIRREYYETKL
ncbi:MAG: hypothetical protein ACI4MS_05795 [Candidatus Coproplasma sp.]